MIETREFELKVKRDPNAKLKTWRVKAKTQSAAEFHCLRTLKIQGAKNPQILSVRELTTNK